MASELAAPESLPEDLVVADALEVLNSVLERMGRPLLAALPRGDLMQPGSCPVARALGPDAAVEGGWLYGPPEVCAAVTALAGGAPALNASSSTRVRCPEALELFHERFDAGHYPAYEAGGPR